MDNNEQNSKIVFAITVEELQEEAVNRIGRRLTEDELYIAIKGIDAGLSFDIETVFQTAIEEAVEEASRINKST